MKTISVAMENHLKGDTTTLTTCWQITRQDQEKFFYTELDKDIKFEGDVYRSAAGFNKSAMKSSADLSVDEMEITGFLRDDGISDAEMRNGAFDFALVEVFMINYEDESMGRIRLRYGYFGEVKTTGSGAFLVELRGLVDLLAMKIGNTYLNECRLDVGDSKCGLIFTPPEHRKGKNYLIGDRVLFPQASIRERPKHYPQWTLKDSGRWTTQLGWWGSDMVMTTYTQPEAAAVALNSNKRLYLYPVDFGLTETDIATGNYHIKFTAKVFAYWEDSSGALSIDCKKESSTTSGIFIPIPTGGTSLTPIPYTVPGRRWRDVSVEVDMPVNTGQIEIKLDGYGSPNGDRAVLLFDDMDIIVSRIDEEDPPFVSYEGVEFIATTDGTASITDVELNPAVGAFTVDGTVTWESIYPKYRFLGEISALSNSSTEAIVAAPIAGAPANWFDWGVMTFLTGDNAGRAMEIMLFDDGTNTFKLALPLPYQPQVGDKFSVAAGCNKTASECSAKFANILNFRGHPRVPGAGQYFKVAGIG